MKVHLAFHDRDLDLEDELRPNADALIQDLGLELVFRAMAGGDKYLYELAQRTLLASLHEPAAIRYRQAVLADCLAHPAVIRELYALAVAALGQQRRHWMYSTQYPESVLHRSTKLIGEVLVQLRRLRDIATEQAGDFASDGFRRLFAELRRELDDAYLRSVEAHLAHLEFHDGVRLSATLGTTNAETAYVLRRRVERPSWRERIGLAEADSYTYEVDPRDMAGADALGALRSRGIALAAAALGESTDHIMAYFAQLRAELGFYLGCMNLHDHLTAKGEPTCMPEPVAAGTPALAARGLYDVGLSLALGASRAVGCDLEAEGKQLIVVTGANRGGKSTFLRSLGLAQLLLQAGMFVPALVFRADVRRGLFTHFRREEDATLRSGKLDEELGRMSAVVDQVGSGSLVLLNESFASTNEREGSEIGRQIVRALLENGVKVAYVTHMFDLASGLHAERDGEALFLRAERLPDGRRTFRIVPGEPLPTSHGQDIYRRIFTESPATDEAASLEVDPARP
jgi:DNA mismatch repair ATPase MutS